MALYFTQNGYFNNRPYFSDRPYFGSGPTILFGSVSAAPPGPPVWLPTGAVMYADFQAGNYYTGGATTTLGNMLAGTYDAPTANGLEILSANSSRPIAGTGMRSYLFPQDSTMVFEIYKISAGIASTTYDWCYCENFAGGGSIEGRLDYQTAGDDTVILSDDFFVGGGPSYTQPNLSDTVLKLAVANTSAGMRGSWNGDVAALTAGIYIDLDTAQFFIGYADFGGGPTRVFNGYIRKIWAYATILSDAELQTISTP